MCYVVQGFFLAGCKIKAQDPPSDANETAPIATSCGHSSTTKQSGFQIDIEQVRIMPPALKHHRPKLATRIKWHCNITKHCTCHFRSTVGSACFSCGLAALRCTHAFFPASESSVWLGQFVCNLAVLLKPCLTNPRLRLSKAKAKGETVQSHVSRDPKL